MLNYPDTTGSRYLALGRAAELIAGEDPLLSVGQVLERLKCAMFRGEFDAPPSSRALSGLEYMRIAVVIPKCEMTDHQQALNTRPKRYYDMNRDSITSVILSDDGLPGNLQLLDHWVYGCGRKQEVFDHLAATPLTEFPETGRRMIADIWISQARIATWLAIHGYPAPSCLRQPGDYSSTNENSASPRLEPSAMNKEPGRPELPGWAIVREHIVKLRGANPKMPYKVLAYEARQEALKFCEIPDVPSEATILRRMKEILNN